MTSAPNRIPRNYSRRLPTVSEHPTDIEETHDTYQAVTRPVTASLDMTHVYSTKLSLRRCIAENTRLGILSFDDNFFQAGMDPLEVIRVAQAIDGERKKVEAGDVYENPTISNLASFLHASNAPNRADMSGRDSWIDIQRLYEELLLTMQESFDGTHKGLTDVFLFHEEKNSKVSSDTIHSDDDLKKNTTQSHSVTNDKSVVPLDGGLTAWLQVLASFLINLNNFGLVNSFGAYQTFYEQNFLSDHDPSSIAWIGTLQAALALIIGAFSGPLFDKGYLRIVLLIAGTTLIFAQMMLSLATEYYQIMLAQGLLIGLCCGLLYVPSLAMIPLYFRKRRGLALGLGAGGGSVGGVLYPIIFRLLVNHVGFGWATRVIGFIMLTTLTIAFLLIRPTDQIKKPRRDFFDPGAMKEIPFVTFMISTFLIFTAYLIAYFLTPAYASDELHASEDLSFYLLAVLNAAQFFGRVIPATLSDFVGGEVLLFSGELLAGIIGLCWIAVHDMGGFVTFLILYGFMSGMAATLPSTIVPHISPSLNVIGTRMGMVYGSAGLGALIGAPIATAANDATGGYLGSQLYMGVCALVASMMFSVTGVASFRKRKAIDKGQQHKRSRQGKV